MHMRRIGWLFTAVLTVIGLMAAGALAQTGTMPDQPAMNQSHTTVQQGVVTSQTTVTCPVGMVTYNPSAEISVTGQVVSGPILGASTDTDYHMVIRTPDGMMRRVWLAPASFLCDMAFNPPMNSQVTVVGVPVSTGGDILARHVVWNGRTYTVRNVTGTPLWAGTANEELMRYSTMWNENRVRTISGRVDRIERVHPGGPTMGPAVAIRVQESGLEDEGVPSWQRPPGELQPTFTWVHLGPAWYVEQQLPNLHEGQTVTVTGSPATYDGRPILIASSLQSGSRVVAFRSSMGRPMWAGGWLNWNQGTMIGAMPTVSGFQSISGRIESAQNVQLPNLGSSTILAIRTADNQLVNVAIVPSGYAQHTGVSFLPGNQVTVVGSPNFINGQQVLVANQIDYNNQRFVMQNVNGACMWNTTTTTAVLPMTGTVSPGGTPSGSTTY